VAATEQGFDFVPSTEIDAVARDAGLDEATVSALVEDYEDASLKALKAGLLAAAFLALGALALTGGLPHDRPEPRPVG